MIPLPEAIMLALVMVSAITDMRRRLIYDAFTFPSMLAGIYLGLQGGAETLGWSLAGVFAGLLVLYPFYRIGGMGLGDLKLMGAVGSLGGFPFLVSAVVDTALAGGVMAIILMVWQGRTAEILSRSPGVMTALFSRSGTVSFPESPDKDTIPYGVAICFGTIFAWLMHWPW